MRSSAGNVPVFARDFNNLGFMRGTTLAGNARRPKCEPRAKPRCARSLNRDNPKVDVFCLANPDSIRPVNEELGIELTPLDVPNVVDLYPNWYEGYKRQAVGIDCASWGVTYRTDSGIAAPTSWLDLFKPEYKGKAIVPNLTGSGGIVVDVLLCADAASRQRRCACGPRHDIPALMRRRRPRGRPARADRRAGSGADRDRGVAHPAPGSVSTSW
jgi:hypothetical protein